MSDLDVSVDRIAAETAFCGVHDPSERLTHTVVSNTTDGAWPIADHLGELLTP